MARQVWGRAADLLPSRKSDKPQPYPSFSNTVRAMPLFQKRYLPDFEDFFSRYEQRFTTLLSMAKPRSWMRFNSKLRNLLGTIIQFDPRFSNTRSESVREADKSLMKLSDLWYTVENLYAVAREEGLVKLNRWGKLDLPFAFAPEEFERFGIGKIMENFNAQLRQKLLNTPNRKADLLNYLAHLVVETSGQVSLLLKEAATRLEQGRDLLAQHLFALAYATRDTFVQQGQSAKTWVEHYRTKTLVLGETFDALVLIVLNIANALLEEKLSAVPPKS